MAMAMKRCITRESTHRKFIFNKPFLIFLKQTSEMPPYFVAWVANSEILIKEEGV